jgi:hypothetical protein
MERQRVSYELENVFVVFILKNYVLQRIKTYLWQAIKKRYVGPIVCLKLEPISLR